MEYNEFINLVQHRAGLDSEADALRAVEATLSTLAERIQKNEAKQLAAQLPHEIQPYLNRAEPQKEFGLEEFYERVSRRESIGYPLMERHARAVISVVLDAVSPGEMRDVLANLPDEYVPLFTFGADGNYRKL
jgi:uncharacterized protein (DUF2267 family)